MPRMLTDRTLLDGRRLRAFDFETLPANIEGIGFA